MSIINVTGTPVSTGQTHKCNTYIPVSRPIRPSLYPVARPSLGPVASCACPHPCHALDAHPCISPLSTCLAWATHLIHTTRLIHPTCLVRTTCLPTPLISPVPLVMFIRTICPHVPPLFHVSMVHHLSTHRAVCPHVTPQSMRLSQAM